MDVFSLFLLIAAGSWLPYLAFHAACASAHFLHHPVARPRPDDKFSTAGHPHFEAVITGGGSVRRETEHILRMQFRAQFFDRIFKASLAGKRERRASSPADQRVSGLRLIEPRKFPKAAKDIHTRLRRRHMDVIDSWKRPTLLA